MTPLIVEVVRGDMVESRHAVTVAVVDAAGAPVLEAGETGALVYPRSAIKPIQALAIVESGAAYAFGLGDAELALASASHSGEPRHAALVASWLARIGLGESDLECGAHAPSDANAALALALAGEAPSALHNNCSGKHAGFLSVARHLGLPTRGYIAPGHESQRRALAILAEMAGCDLAHAPHGVDGCGIPVAGMKLAALARAWARFADPAREPADRRAAILRVRAAMTAEPFLVAGTGRFTTRVIAATQGAVLVKEGAEGVYCGAVPGQGLGIALKAADGASRAASVAIGEVLRRLGALDGAASLADALQPTLRNHAGRAVGAIRVAAGAP